MRATWLRQPSRPPMEPELGSTSAPFQKKGADRVVVGETNRAVEGLGGLMRTVPSPQQVGANRPVGLVRDYRNAHRFDPATPIRLELRGVRHARPRAPRQRRLMARVASADHRTWLWRPNLCARCGRARRAPIESPPRSGIVPGAHEPPTPRAHARPRQSVARAMYGDPVLTAVRIGRPRRGVRGAAPRSEAVMPAIREPPVHPGSRRVIRARTRSPLRQVPRRADRDPPRPPNCCHTLA